MVLEMKLVVSENGKIIETVTKPTGTHPGDIIKTLEDFRKSANTALTKLMENLGDSSDTMDLEDEEQDEDDDEEAPATPKKKKK